MENLLARYGDQKVAAKMDQLQQLFARPQPAPPVVDDWSECGIKRAEDIRDLFVPNFYFGCEADDPINAWAFNRKVNPFGVRLNAMFGSDIGHWDVPDMREVVKEAYEQVEEELMSEEDFRDFVFTNAVSLFAGTNPDFFKGTAVQASVESLISETPSALE